MKEFCIRVPQAQTGGPVIMTALIYAASKGYTPIMKTLLKQGSSVNARASDGSTALMWAARRGHLDIMDVLLAGGADPHATDDKGRTALDHALLTGHREAAEILEKTGAPAAR
ncbi:MAG: ankyrin repeat domain-containing protein [Deltaproteobacteria bacterium]|nr:ankyrin repeat domain-containing protein [Deltaproteobacteria bacterium]